MGRISRFVALGLASVALAVWATGCGDSAAIIVSLNGEPDTLEIIAIDSIAIAEGEFATVIGRLDMEVGDVAELTATAFNSLGQPIGSIDVEWASEEPGIASVTPEGIVTAVSDGTTNIGATVDGITAIIITNVGGGSGGGDGGGGDGGGDGGGGGDGTGTLSLAPAAATLYGIGTTRQFTVVALDNLGNTIVDPELTWTSGNRSVVTVSTSGLVTTTGLGSTAITVTSPCCAQDRAAIVVNDEGDRPSPGVVFAADWGTATGSSVAALGDGGRLGLLGYPADAALTVVSAAPLGVPNWPTNVLEIHYMRGISSLVGRGDGWPAPEPGQTVYFRMLVYHDMPDGAAISNDHGNQSNLGLLSHSIMLTNAWGESPDENHYAIGFRADDGGNYLQMYNPRIPERRPIRVEWALTREGTGANARVDMRVYDESVSVTDPQWDDFDFVDNFGIGTTSLGDLDPLLDMGNLSDGFRSFVFGTSGSGPSDACCIYIGGFAVSLTDWVGPYVPGEAD